jgi:hypothetical protein
VCSPGQSPGPPADTAAAMAMTRAGLAFLASADVASLPVAAQAGLLRDLERASSVHIAARARVLGAFTAQAGYAGDGHGAPGAWLRWQASITRGAASGAVGWMRRLEAHPLVASALAAEEISESWGRQICAWTDRLSAEHRQDGDKILLAAASAGADLADLSGLAEEMYRRTAAADSDGDGGGGDGGGFGDRSLQLDIHFRGAGRLAGDLTPECAAAVQAVLDSLGKRAGPEDDRSAGQRRHDALEEACRRLVGSGGLPDVAGQPVQVQLHMTLDQLRSLDGAADLERAWLAGRAAGDGQPGWASSPAAAQAYACDSQLAPVVSGYLNHAVLAEVTAEFVAGLRPGFPGVVSFPAAPGLPDGGGLPGLPAARRRSPLTALRSGTGGRRGHRPRRRCHRGRWRGCRTPSPGTPPTCCPGLPGWPGSCAPGCWRATSRRR